MLEHPLVRKQPSWPSAVEDIQIKTEASRAETDLTSLFGSHTKGGYQLEQTLDNHVRNGAFWTTAVDGDHFYRRAYPDGDRSLGR